jgi:hypothetical protein
MISAATIGSSKESPMSIADELHNLGQLHERGALSDEEYAAAKEAALAAWAAPRGGGFEESPMRPDSEECIEDRVARLDREWELERQQYMVVGKYGHRSVPSRGLSLLGGAIAAGFGLLWIVVGSAMGQGAAEAGGAFGGVGSLLPLLGGVVIVSGIGVAIYSYLKASRYEEAYERYQRRRADLLLGPPRPPQVQ